MRRPLAVAIAVTLMGCASIDSVFNPGVDPQAGDLQQSAQFRAKLRALMAGTSARDASLVNLDTSKLRDWEARSIPISKETYEGKGRTGYGKYGLPPGLPEDLFGITCHNQLDRPFVYLNYRLKGSFLQRPEKGSTFSEGSCSQLTKDRNTLTVGVFNFGTSTLTAVPSGERIQRLETTLGWREYSLMQTDQTVWEFGNTLVGEAAGYTYETVSILLHASREKKTGNYYRLVLIGERTIVTFDIHGPRSQSVQDLQAAVWPALQTLNWSRSH